MRYLDPALNKIMMIQAGLSITEPVEMQVKRVYRLIPAQNDALPTLPAFINSWTLTNTEPRELQMHRLNYTIGMQLYVAKAAVEDDISAYIATMFWEEALEAFLNDPTLGGTVIKTKVHDARGAWLERGGAVFAGFEGFLDLEISRNWQLGA